MSNVQKYRISLDGNIDHAQDLVRYSDYTALQAQVEALRAQRDKAVSLLKAAHHFMQSVGTEDPDDIETMSSIETLSGQITAGLAALDEAKETDHLQGRPPMVQDGDSPYE